MRRQTSMFLSLLLAAPLVGCESRDNKVRFSQTEGLMPLRAIEKGGDFALFYAGQEKAEVPVRVKSGDTVGFYRVEDGRLKAVAGPFKMDMDPTVREACWKRLNHAQD